MPSLKKLHWYQARLRSMSAVEVVFRCSRAIGGSRDWWRQRYPRPYAYFLGREPFLVPGPTDDAIRLLRERLGIPDPGQARSILEQACPEAVATTVSAARRICAGSLRFFDGTWQYGPDWRWRRDPRSTLEWPLRHWTRADIRKGGAKYVWEPSRHQHLMTLGKAWYWTGDPAFGAELEREFRSWLKQNPPYYGVHWTSGIELAIRVVSWCWALAFAGTAPELSEETKGQLLAGIALQVDHIRGHLSAYSSANNHLIAEAAALAIAGMLYPRLPAATDWRETGLSILSRELRLQVHEDGVGAEQAIHYHGEVLEWYLMVAAIERRLGGATYRAWKSRLLDMACFIERISDQRHNVPEYGDSDDAQVAPLGDTPACYYQSLRTVTALVFDDPSVLRGDEPPDERAFWLCGSPGASRGDAPAQPALCVYPRGGWVIHRAAVGAGTESHLAFNCGALGYGPMAAHGHADALSLWLSVQGVPMLVDPGTGTYHENGRVRRYFRSTRAHNTVEVDGLDQSVQTGPTIWSDHAAVELQLTALPPGGLARGAHLGYRRLRDPVVHERTIVWCGPGAYAVLDRILGAAAHQVYQYWHSLPGTDVAIETAESCRMSRHGMAVRLWRWSSAPASWEVVAGCEEPMLGWYSPAYGAYVPALTIRVECAAVLPLTMLTIIDLDSSDPIEALGVDVAGLRALAVRLRRGVNEMRFVLLQEPDRPAGNSEVRTMI